MDHQLIAQAGAVAGGIDSQTVIRAAALIGAGLGAIGVGVPGIGIGIALAILTFVGAQIIKAFRGGGTR